MKRTNNKSLLIFILIAIIMTFMMIFSFGCVKEEPKGIKIGVINSLTGSAGIYGQNGWNGIQLAVEEINNSGGIKGRKIKILLEDDKSEAKTSISAFKKLVDVDKTPVVIGPASSSSVMASAPIANKTKTVILSPGAGSPNITYAGDYIFRNRASGALESIEIASFAVNSLKLKTMCVFYINTDYGVGFKDVFRDQFEKLDGKIIIVDSYDQGQTDFRTQLSKIKEKNPDGVYILGVPIEVGHILRQAAETGFKTKFLMNNMESPELIKIAGNAAEGIYFAIPVFDPNSPDPRVEKFTEKYKNKYKKLPDMFAADGYDAVYLIKLAIEKGGYNGDGIKNALYNIKNFPGVNGLITFDKNGDVIKPLTIKTVKNGEFVIVK